MPQIILFRGKPGVGKTTLSNSISQKLGLPVIRKDDIYDSIPSDIEHQSKNQISEAILKTIIETNIGNGLDVIIDNSYHHPNHIKALQQWADSRGLALTTVLVICSDEGIWRKRFNQRKLNPLPNQLITDFDELKRHYKSMDTLPLPGELILDSIQPIENLVENAILYLHND